MDSNGVTARELIEILSEYDENLEVVLPQCSEDGKTRWNAHITYVELGDGFDEKKSIHIV